MKKVYFILVVCTYSLISAQLGINTSSPSGILHVDAAKDNGNTIPTSATVVNDVVVAGTTGNLGIGNSAPIVKLDVRGDSNTNGSAIGIGTSNLTATNAKAGALQYNNNTLQYSNGTDWITLASTTPTTKAVVIATNTSAPTVTDRTSLYLGNWTKIYDPNNNFTAGTASSNTTANNSGFFTAPRDGVYLATFTFGANSTVNAATVNQNQVEAIWEIRNKSGSVYNSFKCANNFPANSINTSNALVSTWIGSNCTASINMKAGEKLYPFIWVDITPVNGTFNLTADGSYNNLTIVEH